MCWLLAHVYVMYLCLELTMNAIYSKLVMYICDVGRLALSLIHDGGQLDILVSFEVLVVFLYIFNFEYPMPAILLFVIINWRGFRVEIIFTQFLSL